MSESFTEHSSQGWFSRIIGSFVGVLVGLALMAGAGGLLFWNEGRTVKRAKDLEAGQQKAIRCRRTRLTRPTKPSWW